MYYFLLHHLGLAVCYLPSVSSLEWPKDRALPDFPDVAKSIDAADITYLSGEEQGLLVTLQGIVNRKEPRIYLYWDKTGDDPEGVNYSHQAWLQGIANQIDVHDVSESPLQLLNKYEADIKGAVLYDEDLPDMINLATTLAGMHDLVITNAELAKAHNLTITHDLRGMFKNKLDVYEYGLTQLYSTTTKRMITAIRPQETIQNTNASWTNITKDANHTLDASNNATYPVDLTSLLSKARLDDMIYLRIKDAFEEDGNGPTVSHVLATMDDMTIADFAPGTLEEEVFLVDWGGSSLGDYPWGSRAAGGKAYIVYGFKVPNGSGSFVVNLTMHGQYDVAITTDLPVTRRLNAVFRDYIAATSAPCIWLDPNNRDEVPLLHKILDSLDSNSAYMGWFPNGDEMSGVTQTAQKSVYVVAADNFFNGSLMSGLKKLLWRPRLTKEAEPPYKSSAVKPIEDKIYISLTWTEGDNIQYSQHRMRLLWDDTARGKVPMSWTINPLLIDIAPNIVGYFQATATENDSFVLGPSGAGYTFPVNWPKQDLRLFLDQTARYSKRTGVGSNSIWIYNRINSTLVPLSEDIISTYHDALGPELLGISADTARGAKNPYGINITRTGVAVAGLASISGVEQGLARLGNISKDYFGGRTPLFVDCALYAWDTTPGNISTLVQNLGKEFEVNS
ncbi:uncharacterized protein MYCFIDRAFT_79855 [Pseudocercospora fijiensis CIRAD86]|uniref:GxGYxYP putative glycoside hydrolase N-terminal domain-containing protein n=1 Tax=Pseudocercospora fijiensis (strain CIRAD86) TaxID=383855 RepID=M2ZIS0_PSEFD|nr:uncharacterized protein MYCFIDRAFT_79855 [Pseudocercospora fijiensis CIRAD86]EME79014.1 hypothetical protein MYCFIDRAFT_79855 [Pseudocercospora fijiensis CIRAD86]